MESREIISGPDETLIVGNKLTTNWNVDSISFDWGAENTAATSGLAMSFRDQITGKPLDKKIPVEADRVDLVVSNTKTLEGIINPAADGTINATIASSLLYVK